MTFISAMKKLCNRNTKVYYEASDILTKKEKQLLFVTTSMLIIPLLIGTLMFVIG